MVNENVYNKHHLTGELKLVRKCHFKLGSQEQVTVK